MSRVITTTNEARDLKAEERKGQILEAATTVFARKGYHLATMDDIVRESKLSKGALYWYFKSKKEIFLELLHRFIVTDQTNLLEILQAKTTFADRLKAFFEWLSVMQPQEQACHMETGERRLVIEFWHQAVIDPDVEAAYKKAYEFWFDFGEQLISEAIANGEIRELDAVALSGILVALADGILCHWVLGVNRANQKMLDMLYVFLMQNVKKES